MQRHDIEVRNSAQGYNYRAFLGAQADENGNLNPASADRIVGGWAATYEQAERKAIEVLNDD